MNWQIAFYVIVICGCLAAIANLVITIFLAIFLVNLKDSLKEFFSDFVEALSGFEPPAPVVIKEERQKTWDEKWELHLEELERRRRAESGLQDLPDPTVNWGQPPAPPPAEDGFVVKDK